MDVPLEEPVVPTTTSIMSASSPAYGSPDQSPSPILLDTLFLVFLRLVYFLLSRRFLLSTINPTLREISAPDNLLPTNHSLRERDQRLGHDLGITPLSMSELEGEPDTEDDLMSANSSYPGTPIKGRPAYSDGPSPSESGGPEDGIELESLGQRLRDVGSGMRKKVHVLQLSHGASTSNGGTGSGVKKTTKGLNRAAKYVAKHSAEADD